MSDLKMDIIHPDINKYLDRLLPERHPVLQEMEKVAKDRNFPIIGPQVGRILYQYAKLIGAKRIFELGSGFGYSAFWFALALPEEGKVICTEGTKSNIEQAEKYLNTAGLLRKVEFNQGDALKILAQTEGPFDIILNDIDKHDYPSALAAAVPKLRVGGLLITDNALWHGRVVNASAPDASTKGVLEYNRLAFSADNLWTTILPVRDGLAVSVKLE
jgi:predicted O-methyltransferase YrrM